MKKIPVTLLIMVFSILVSSAADEQEKDATNRDLSAVRSELEKVVSQLKMMKEREAQNRGRLESLEVQLTKATESARAESKKLQAAAESLGSWERRAHLAEDELERTREAASISLKVARFAKAGDVQRREELAKLRAAHTDQTARLETAAHSLQQVTIERDSLRKDKSEAEQSMARLRTELASAQKTANQVPGLEESITALKAELKEKTTAEVIREREKQRLTKSAEKMKTRLDELLLSREELGDELTILRSRLARAHTMSEVHEQLLQDRDARLAQLERSLRAKENALQKAYQSEDSVSSKLAQAEKARHSLAEALKDLKQASQQRPTP